MVEILTNWSGVGVRCRDGTGDRQGHQGENPRRCPSVIQFRRLRRYVSRQPGRRPRGTQADDPLPLRHQAGPARCSGRQGGRGADRSTGGGSGLYSPGMGAGRVAGSHRVPAGSAGTAGARPTSGGQSARIGGLRPAPQPDDTAHGPGGGMDGIGDGRWPDATHRPPPGRSKRLFDSGRTGHRDRGVAGSGRRTGPATGSRAPP